MAIILGGGNQVSFCTRWSLFAVAQKDDDGGQRPGCHSLVAYMDRPDLAVCYSPVGMQRAVSGAIPRHFPFPFQRTWLVDR